MVSKYEWGTEAIADEGSLRDYVIKAYGPEVPFTEHRQIHQEIVEEVAAGKCHNSICPSKSAIKHAQLADALRTYKAQEDSTTYHFGRTKLRKIEP